MAPATLRAPHGNLAGFPTTRSPRSRDLRGRTYRRIPAPPARVADGVGFAPKRKFHVFRRELPRRFLRLHDERIHAGIGPASPVPPTYASVGRGLLGFLAFAFLLLLGAILQRVHLSWRRRRADAGAGPGQGRWPQPPAGSSDRKEPVEWVNMVVGKLWKVYREGIESWAVGSLQPVLDGLERPRFVEGVGIRRFSLGEGPLSVRSVERRTSRLANDLRYRIGIRYTGDARMLLSLKLNCGFLPFTVPVWIRDFDIDGELWVKLQLISTEPWIGAMSWTFVSLPKIKFVLSPFHLFNLMGVPVLSTFLRKLLTEDLPQLFVHPNKVVVDFLDGKSLDPVPDGYESTRDLEGNEYAGELSVTLVDARNLSYILFAKSDPHVVLSLGEQVLCSKRNSQTSVVGPPSKPIWNQDFHMLVKNPRTENLKIQVMDSIGFIQFTVGVAEITVGSLKDTVPVDKLVALRGSWTPWNKGFSGEILLRLTYKAYVEDEEDAMLESMDSDLSNIAYCYSEGVDCNQRNRRGYSCGKRKRSFMDVLTALLPGKELEAKLTSEVGESKITEDAARLQFSLTKHLQNSDSTLPPISISEGFRESPSMWIAAIASTAILISAYVGGPHVFHP